MEIYRNRSVWAAVWNGSNHMESILRGHSVQEKVLNDFLMVAFISHIRQKLL